MWEWFVQYSMLILVIAIVTLSIFKGAQQYKKSDGQERAKLLRQMGFAFIMTVFVTLAVTFVVISQ